MIRIGFLHAVCTVTTALLLAACSQDDFSGGPEERLPEGKYPLQISSVSISTESSSEPWDANAPQTRVMWKDSIIVNWTDGDLIGVQIPGSGKTGEYKVKVDQSRTVTGLEAETELYWESRASVRVKSWYPADTVNDIPLNNQKDERHFAYVLYGETDKEVNYQTKGEQVHFVLSHQLSRIRVKLTGYGRVLVQNFNILTYPSCRFRPNEGTKVIGSGTPEFIRMGKVTYDYSSNMYFEAHVVPGYEIREVYFIGMAQQEFRVTLSSPVTPVAGKTHVIIFDCKASDEP